MALDPTRRDAIVASLAAESDVAKLRNWIDNATRQGETALADVARRRLYTLGVKHPAGSFEHEVWVSIHALEDALSAEKGKTTRLARTRQKISRSGEHRTVVDLILAKEPSDGFTQLVDRHMQDLLFEAVALRHPDRFEAEVLQAAQARIDGLTAA